MEAPLALYRRYRPDTFSEVIGQDHVTAPLRNALSNNRVNHAYLFSGPRGCGKTTSARILARAINCEKGPIAEPCGVCKSCTDLARGGPGSIDVIEIDAASHGGVDDARDLRERAFFAPVESRYKIYIIDEAHMVTTQGFNALLKLVEEPPPHLKFIFATTEPDKVIGTIRSRTHHYPFRLVPPKVLGDYMAFLCESEGVTIESAVLPLVVRAGAGSVRDSLSVLDQLIGGAGPEGVTYELAVALLGFTPDSLLDACVDGFAAHDSAAVFETIEKVIETGQDPKRFAEDLLRRLRDLVILSAVPNAVASGLIEAAEDQGQRLQTQAAGIGAAELTRAADIVAAGLLEMRGATAPRLQLELICAKVLLPGADDSTNGIQARLDRMERRLTIGVPAGTPDAAPAQPIGAPVSSGDLAGGPGQDAATSRAAARATAGGTGGVAPAGAAAGAGAAESNASGADAGASGAAAGADAASTGGADAAPTGGAASAAGGASGGGDAADRGAGAAGGAAARGAAGAGTAGSGRGRGDVASGASGASGAGSAAGAGRTGAWGDESASAGAGQATGGGSGAVTAGASASASGSGTGAAPGAGSAGALSGAGTGSVGLADVRRLWPEVLEAVKSKRRFAWIMLSQNAQVIGIDEQTLTLGLVNAGARESFARSGSDEILRQAMIDTIGLNRRIEAVVDPSTDPGGGGGQQAGGPRAGGPQAGSPGSGGPGSAGPGSGGSGAGGPGAGGPGSAAPGSGGPGSGGPGSAGSGPGGSGSAGLGAGGSAAGGSEAGGVGAGPGAGGAGAGTGGAGAGGSAAGGPASGPSAGGPGTGAGAGGSSAGSSADGPGTGPGAGADARSGSWGAGETAGGAARGSGGDQPGGGQSAENAGGTAGGSRGAASAGEWGDGGGTAIALQEPPPDPEYDVPPEDPWEDGPVGRSAPRAGRAGGAQTPGGPQATGVSGSSGASRPTKASDRREQAASKRRAAEAAVAAEQARRAAAAPVAPEVPLTPEEEADAIGEDDMVLEEDSRSHTDLLRETLGAQIITEEPN
ncbi:DNA polymerase III subunit gamma and tau [Kribbella sp. NPDC026596]|uniref:DNA polymerase III subunit gamma and tau n=1 Tax=Kribbella sp. NPDC026596 TaxID=3155122 RepID=UPI0033FBCEF1